MNLELPAPEVYYDPQGKCYFIRNDRGCFIQVTESNVKSMLRQKGMLDKPRQGDFVSEIDRFLNDTRVKRDVDYAGPLAGYPVGHVKVQGRRVLVTEPPTFIPAVDGGWATLEKLFRGLLGPDAEDVHRIRDAQIVHFYSWLKVAMTTLRAEKRRPGQVLVVAGPAGSGKSFLQNLVTRLLGGRSAKPYQYMTGATQFNSDLFTAEHLMVEDEAASFDFRVRVKMGAMLKGQVVNEDQRCHPKHGKPVTLRPFWRTSMTLNDDPESLMVLPPLEGISDKVMLFRAHKTEMPMSTETLEQWGAFMALIDAEMPAFVYFILNRFEIPESLRCGRYGVKHFHHQELLDMMSVLSPETKLLELIDAKLFPKGSGSINDWEGKASELETEICGTGSSVAHEARKLLIYNSACGQYLGRIAHMHPERVQKSGVIKGFTYWKICAPK